MIQHAYNLRETECAYRVNVRERNVWANLDKMRHIFCALTSDTLAELIPVDLQRRDQVPLFKKKKKLPLVKRFM